MNNPSRYCLSVERAINNYDHIVLRNRQLPGHFLVIVLRNSTPTVLYRINTARNMYRFCTFSVEPNLFGGGSFIQTWGRIGTLGRVKIKLFDDESTAQEECDRWKTVKQKRGYL